VKWKKLRNEYFFNRYFLVVQNLRFILCICLQQISVEQKAKKQGEGEKRKKRVKTTERQTEIRRRQIKKIQRAKETNATNTLQMEVEVFDIFHSVH